MQMKPIAADVFVKMYLENSTRKDLFFVKGTDNDFKCTRTNYCPKVESMNKCKFYYMVESEDHTDEKDV